MKLLTAAAILSSAAAFAPTQSASRSTNLMSTIEAGVPERVAPDAGFMPEWEDRPGLAPEEFMQSDMDKPDLSGMWECPLTRWDSEGINVAEAQRMAKKVPHCPMEVRASSADNAKGAQYFADNADKIKQDLLKYGAIWFRGFDLMKSVNGYRDMYEALGMDPCLDPLHSSGLRKFASERDALYEEVNKPSLRGHYIGLHCESTAKRTAAYCGVCMLSKGY